VFFASLSIRCETTTTDSDITRQTRSKLEHYGFNQLARPASLRNSKRQILIKENKTKKIRPNDIITPNQYVFIHFLKIRNDW